MTLEDAALNGRTEDLVLRRAVPADIPELVRLRQVIFEGHPAEHQTDWLEHCARFLGERLASDGGTLCAAVVGSRTPGGQLAASAIGWIDLHLPSPVSTLGTLGYIGSVTTDASYRGRGLASQVLAELMAWFAERDVPRVELQTTPDAFALYEKFGFAELRTPAMRWYRGDAGTQAGARS